MSSNHEDHDRIFNEVWSAIHPKSWQPGDEVINIHDPEYVRYARIFNDITRAPRRGQRFFPFSQRKDIAEHLWRLGYSKPEGAAR